MPASPRFLTDGANFRSPYYHQMTDTLETLDFEFMANVVPSTVATVAKQAGLQHAGVGVSEPFPIRGNVATTPMSVGRLKRSLGGR